MPQTLPYIKYENQKLPSSCFKKLFLKIIKFILLPLFARNLMVHFSYLSKRFSFCCDEDILPVEFGVSSSSERFSNTSVIPLLSASNSHLNLCSSESSLLKYLSTDSYI